MADGSSSLRVVETERTYLEIPVAELHPIVTQPRDLPRADREAMRAKVADITGTLAANPAGEPLDGKTILDPLRVRRLGEGVGFEIVDGERRWWAASFAGLKRITCEIVVLSDEQVAE